MAGEKAMVMKDTERTNDTRGLGAAARATASWLVPPVLIPIFLVGSIVAYALYRFVHLGPAAFG